MKNIKYFGLSVLVAMAIISCSTSKTLVSSGEYDDLYGSSSDSPVAYSPTVSRTIGDYDPQYLTEYNDAFDRPPIDTSIQGTDTYYDENYVSSSNLKRKYTPDAGYSSGYADGYSEGWNNNAWGGNNGFNNWNSFNSPFGFNSSFAFSPFRNGFGSYLGNNSLMYGGGINNFGFSPFGFNNFGNSPFGFNNFGNRSLGFNSFGYSPFGFNRFGNPWGYSSYGFNSFGNPYNGTQPAFINGVDGRLASNNRSFGPRNSGRATSAYNDGFVNTRRPTATASSRRVATRGVATTSGTRSSITERANGSVIDGSNGKRYSPSVRRPASYDAYTRTSSVRRAGSTNSPRSRAVSPAATPRSRVASSSRNASTYSRGSTSSRSYTPQNSANRSTPTRSSGNYSRPNTNNSSFSRSSSSSSSSARSSSGSSSRGASSSSSSRSGSSGRPR